MNESKIELLTQTIIKKLLPDADLGVDLLRVTDDEGNNCGSWNTTSLSNEIKRAIKEVVTS